MKRERNEEEATDIESNNDDNDNDVVNITDNINDINDVNSTNKTITNEYITMRKIRSGKRIMISTVPSLVPLVSKYKKVDVVNTNKSKDKSKDKSKSKKKGNNNNNDDTMTIYHCGWKITFDDNGNPIAPPNIPIPEESTNNDNDINVIEDNTADDDNNNDIKPLANVKISKDVGGGVRRGFGSLLSTTTDKKKATTTTRDPSTIDKKETSGSDDCGCLPMANEVPENDDDDEQNPYLSGNK